MLQQLIVTLFTSPLAFVLVTCQIPKSDSQQAPVELLLKNGFIPTLLTDYRSVGSLADDGPLIISPPHRLCAAEKFQDRQPSIISPCDQCHVTGGVVVGVARSDAHTPSSHSLHINRSR
jgi:hypothetical protein